MILELIYYSICFNCLLSLVKSDDVLGCNGFIKSDVAIDYSRLEVKLFTKERTLLEETECAPNNGYYFLPVYDKGDYILKVFFPVGWEVEPPEVAIKFDGATDPCSLGKDINFSFKGFSIFGQVVSSGQAGPDGVNVELYTHSTTLLMTTTTRESGKFSFSPVLPGTYTVKIAHPRWKLLKSEVVVTIKNDNAKIDREALSVAGYDVTGSVTSDAQPITGVSFLLFSETKKPSVGGCDKTPLADFNVSNLPLGGLNFICHVTSDSNGAFHFPQVAPGDYVIVPHYKGSKSTKFHVHPQTLKITVPHNSLQLNTPFEVKGFTVSGKVLWSPNGKPLKDAQIFVNGKLTAKTGSDGVYNIESMRAGSYSIKVVAEKVVFKDVDVKVSSTVLPDFYPSEYQICGNFHSGSSVGPFKVEIKRNSDGWTHQVATDSKGSYCVFLPPSEYSFSPLVEREGAILFSPQKRTVNVINSNLESVDFSQLRSTVKGKIICMSVCPLITVNLKPKGHGGSLQTIAKGGKYEFREVLPGDYDAYIEPGLDWCWDKELHSVSVINEITEIPLFTQSGYSVTIVSSHQTKIVYYSESHPGDKFDLSVSPGSTHICVPKSATYIFEPKGCHGYDEPKIRWTSGVVSLLATSHANSFTFTASHPINDLKLTATGSDKVAKTIDPVLVPNPQGVRYDFTLQLKEGEIQTVTPQAGIFLFTPLTAEVKGSSDCVNVTEPLFTAQKGQIVSGRVYSGENSGLGDVLISITDGEGNIVATQLTSQDGSYKFPPINEVPNYKVIAEKEGFVLTGLSRLGDFSAHKLAEIIVNVRDLSTSEKLEGVLLSLSGGQNYRRNAQTNADGTMSFLSLSPGEYFLKPMMKEFKFHPSNKIIDVKEGATVRVSLSGERIAYSGMGQVISLNGAGEENVVVEAVGQGDCNMLKEEATSNESGDFRIRGLKPNCIYTVRVKKGPNVNQHVEKSTPENVNVKVVSSDVRDLKLYAIRPISRLGVLVYVSTNRPEDLKTLRLKLSREETPDVPVSLTKLAEYKPSPSGYSLKSVVVSLPPLPTDGRNYILQLESSIPLSSFDYSSRPVHFKAAGPTKVFKFPFFPQLKAKDTEPQSSYLILTLLITLGLALYNKEALTSLLHLTLERFLTQSPTSSLKQNSVDDPLLDLMDFTKKKTKSRKT